MMKNYPTLLNGMILARNLYVQLKLN